VPSVVGEGDALNAGNATGWDAVQLTQDYVPPDTKRGAPDVRS
jgi:hypothetical protein